MPRSIVPMTAADSRAARVTIGTVSSRRLAPFQGLIWQPDSIETAASTFNYVRVTIPKVLVLSFGQVTPFIA
jgi:hypothetical protein